MFMYGKKQAAKESKAKTNIMELCVTGHGIPLFYFYIYRIQGDYGSRAEADVEISSYQ